MAHDHVREFTDDNFRAEVLDSPTPVLVDFWAEWCMPCRMLAPTIDKLASEFAGKVKVGKLDTDKSRNVAVEHQITAIPTVIIFKAGRPVKKLIGLTSEGTLRDALNDALK